MYDNIQEIINKKFNTEHHVTNDQDHKRLR